MKYRRRNTYSDGANRMLFDQSWHSSKPLEAVQPGDILRIKNKDTLECTEWKVTEPSIKLSAEEAKREWLRYPFGDLKRAKQYGYYPYILRNLLKIKEYPPAKRSPRYIPSDVRINVWIRDGGKCKACGCEENLEFDHIIPVTKGGSNTANNIELLCKKCNMKKIDKIQ